MQAFGCKMCDGTIFEWDREITAEFTGLWSHYEDTKCDDPVPDWNDSRWIAKSGHVWDKRGECIGECPMEDGHSVAVRMY